MRLYIILQHNIYHLCHGQSVRHWKTLWLPAVYILPTIFFFAASAFACSNTQGQACSGIGKQKSLSMFAGILHSDIRILKPVRIILVPKHQRE